MGNLTKLKRDLTWLLEAQTDKRGDPETDHEIADLLLINYIDDDEVTMLFKKLIRWYA